MSKRFKYIGAYRPHYLRQWREFRGFNLDDMAAAIVALVSVNGGLTKSSLSRIETGRTPYTRDTLEVYAQVLDCLPIDLLTRPPTDPEGIWNVWNRLHDRDKPRAVAMIEAVFIQRDEEESGAAA